MTHLKHFTLLKCNIPSVSVLNPWLNIEVITIPQKLQWHENTRATHTGEIKDRCILLVIVKLKQMEQVLILMMHNSTKMIETRF